MFKCSSAWEKAKKYGIDMSLIEANLRLTPTERAKALQRSIAFLKALRDAGIKYYEGIRKPH